MYGHNRLLGGEGDELGGDEVEAAREELMGDRSSRALDNAESTISASQARDQWKAREAAVKQRGRPQHVASSSSHSREGRPGSSSGRTRLSGMSTKSWRASLAAVGVCATSMARKLGPLLVQLA